MFANGPENWDSILGQIIPKTQKIYDCVFYFGLVLWHINHCRLFNANSGL